MNDHYYTAEPASAHNYRDFELEIFDQRFLFTTDAGVFSRDGLDIGTRVLLEALPELHGRILDLGCGWGAVGTILSRINPALDITMTDINERAVSLSQKNLLRNGGHAAVVQGDAFENVEGSFDAILTNPPIRAGKQTIYAMFAESANRLKEGGALYIVIRKQQGAPSALKYLQTIFREVEILDKEAGFWVLRGIK